MGFAGCRDKRLAHRDLHLRCGSTAFWWSTASGCWCLFGCWRNSNWKVKYGTVRAGKHGKFRQYKTKHKTNWIIAYCTVGWCKMAIWIGVGLIDAAGFNGFMFCFWFLWWWVVQVSPSYLQCFIKIMWFIQFTSLDFLGAGLLATWKESGGLPTTIVQEVSPFLQVSYFTHWKSHRGQGTRHQWG